MKINLFEYFVKTVGCLGESKAVVTGERRVFMESITQKQCVFSFLMKLEKSEMKNLKMYCVYLINL